MDPQPSTSQKDVDVFLSPRIKRPRKAFTVTEKIMIRNAYKYVKNETSAQMETVKVVKESKCISKVRNAYKSVKNETSGQMETVKVVKESKCISKVAEILGISSRSVSNVLKEVNEGALPTPPKKTGPKRSFKDKIDEFTFSAIRKIVHQFFYRNEPPTIAKILQVMNDDPEMPKVSKETLRKILKHLNIKYVKRSRNSTWTI